MPKRKKNNTKKTAAPALPQGPDKTPAQRNAPPASEHQPKPVQVDAAPLPRSSPMLAVSAMLVAWADVLLGALITTFNSSRAVPGWPGSFGYFWLFSPARFWAHGDVLLMQIHRLLGVALLILLATLAWSLRKTASQPLFGLSILLIAMTMIIAIIGGLRITLDSPSLAWWHACLTPPLLAMLTLPAIIIRRQNRLPVAPTEPASPMIPSGSFWLALLIATAATLYAQIIFGAFLRHVSPYSQSLTAFPFWVWVHTIFALCLLLLPVILLPAAFLSRRSQGDFARKLRRRAVWLSLLVVLQVILGLINWVVNYNFPLWFLDNVMAINYTIVDGGPLQVTVTMAHVLTGFFTLTVAFATAAEVCMHRSSKAK